MMHAYKTSNTVRQNLLSSQKKGKSPPFCPLQMHSQAHTVICTQTHTHTSTTNCTLKVNSQEITSVSCRFEKTNYIKFALKVFDHNITKNVQFHSFQRNCILEWCLPIKAWTSIYSRETVPILSPIECLLQWLPLFLSKMDNLSLIVSLFKPVWWPCWSICFPFQFPSRTIWEQWVSKADHTSGCDFTKWKDASVRLLSLFLV